MFRILRILVSEFTDVIMGFHDIYKVLFFAAKFVFLAYFNDGDRELIEPEFDKCSVDH